MTAPKRPIPETATELLRAGIVLHVLASRACTGQAKAVLALEDELREESGTDRIDELSRLGLQRSVHESESATHAAALTGIGCTLADLEIRGYDITPLVEARAFVEALAQRSIEEEESP